MSGGIRTIARTRAAAAFLAGACLVATAASGQAPATGGGDEDALIRFSYTMRFQAAPDAVSFLAPLLSDQGSVELSAAGDGIVIRDRRQALQRVVPMLRGFDHPRRGLRLAVQVVRAANAVGDAAAGASLPDDLVARLRRLLGFESYRILAGDRLDSEEGTTVERRLGERFELRFRVGTVIGEQRLKLHGFQILRSGEPEPLIETSLNLWLDEPMILGLTRSETSEEALLLVLTATEPED